jgi:small-conductance mechanosensitive channel
VDINVILLQIVLPLGIFIVFGILLRIFVIPFLVKLSHKTTWEGDDVIIHVLQVYIMWWSVLGGLVYISPQMGLKSHHILWVKDGLLAFFILSITLAASKIGGGLTRIPRNRKGVQMPDSTILSNVVKGVIYALGFILILQAFGIKITPLLTALGVGGLAVALALQDTLSNLFAGIQLIASGKTNIGDFIELENGKRGFITDINWRNTTVQTVGNNTVVVPNSTLSNSIIENFFLSDRQITFYINVGVGYESDLDKVEQISIEEARKVMTDSDGGVTDFEPFVRFYNFGDSSIDLKVFVRVEEYADQFVITSQLIKQIHKRYQQEGVNIPFPIRTIIQQ